VAGDKPKYQLLLLLSAVFAWAGKMQLVQDISGILFFDLSQVSDGELRPVLVSEDVP